MGDRTIPMFPLSLVLFPGQILPLHVFEDRYRTMVEEIIDKDREFGVVLIERGSEIGGGDTRKSVGTLAEIIDSEKSNDGRWLLITKGTKRIETSRWLEDSPYPRAEVSFLDEEEFLFCTDSFFSVLVLFSEDKELSDLVSIDFFEESVFLSAFTDFSSSDFLFE